jgi:hypothetical protein
MNETRLFQALNRTVDVARPGAQGGFGELLHCFHDGVAVKGPFGKGEEYVKRQRG